MGGRVNREILSGKIKVIENNKIKTYLDKDYFNGLPAKGVIKIQKKDFGYLKHHKILNHFNLEECGHKPKEKYFLPLIEKRGYLTSKEEKLPILDFEKCYLTECIAVKEHVKYEDLTKKDFKDSFPHIKNVKQLKKEILYRYGYSMPELSKEKILSLGVSITRLKIIEPFFKSKYKSKGSIRSGFGEGLLEAAKINKNIVALTADLTDSLKITKFKETYEDRFYQMGICEQNMMSAAAGMCINNKIPFVASYAVFNPGRNWDQLRVSVCYSNHNVKIIGGHAGLTTGPDGATHQALEDIAITRVIPNLTVVVPSDEEEARKATIAIAKHKGPCYLRLSREKSNNITTIKSEFKLGKANVLEEGKDVTIVACGLGVQFALDAAEKLKKDKIKSTIINMHTIKPLDEKTLIKYAKKTKAIVSVEEHQIIGGLGSAISEVLSQKLPTPQEFVGVIDTFGESGDGYELLEKYGISTKEIIKAVKKVIKRK